MKINELLKKRPTLSFEIFPPKNNENDITSIYATIDELAKMNPDFISVTYGANGSTSKNTCKIASTIKNKYGIDEPIDKQEINKEFLDLMIVPLVGYDANCYRLVYGGGYYDRYLKDFNAPTIGLAYTFQYIEHYQSEDFDIPLDDIITDKKI